MRRLESVSAIKSALRRRTFKLIAEAERIYGVKLPKTTVFFFSGSDDAGWQVGSDRIAYNVELARRNRQVFLDEIVPHEVAHLVQTNTKPLSRQHGKYWHEICLRLGGSGKLYHDMRVPKCILKN